MIKTIKLLLYRWRMYKNRKNTPCKMCDESDSDFKSRVKKHYEIPDSKVCKKNKRNAPHFDSKIERKSIFDQLDPDEPKKRD